MSFKDILTEEDMKAFEKGDYGQRVGYGVSPTLLIIDMTYAFVDPKYDKASGDMGWRAVEALRELIPLCREKGVPIIYTIPISGTPQYLGHKFGISRKRTIVLEPPGGKRNEIVSDIAPNSPDELIIVKPKASAFFETGLVSLLTYYRIDTIIVTGATTSGCVRATVVDGASYGYHVIVPEEAVADRVVISHKVNLVDMDMKYADVEHLENVLAYLHGLAGVID